MRLLIVVIFLLFFFAMTGFVLTNLDTKVAVTVWSTDYPEVPMYRLVVFSAFAGMIVVGIIAVAEGTNIRLANRRLRREIHQLETEINYLRTQPPAGGASEGENLQDDSEPASTSQQRGEERPSPPSAPVYGTEENSWPTDDDDTYSGGRAV